MTITARVRDGRLVVDEPTDLPEGTEVRLLAVDPGDDMDATERAVLHEALARSESDVKAGRLVDAADVLKRLRAFDERRSLRSRSVGCASRACPAG